MGPEMTILECICQVVVFWAVCLVGWVTVKIIECHGKRNRNCNRICNRFCYKICNRICNKKCVTAERRAA